MDKEFLPMKNISERNITKTNHYTEKEQIVSFISHGNQLKKCKHF